MITGKRKGCKHLPLKLFGVNELQNELETGKKKKKKLKSHIGRKKQHFVKNKK